jgi:hypothetical protein
MTDQEARKIYPRRPYQQPVSVFNFSQKHSESCQRQQLFIPLLMNNMFRPDRPLLIVVSDWIYCGSFYPITQWVNRLKNYVKQGFKYTKH